MLERYDITENPADGVLVLIETERMDGNTSLTDPVKEAVGKAKGMNVGRVFGIMFGPAELRSVYPEAFAYGVDTLYHFRTDDRDAHSAEEYADTLMELSDRIHPILLLMTSTQKDKDLAASISAMYGIETNECTDLRWTGDTLVCADRGSERDVCGRLPILISLKSGSLRMPEKEEGRKGTAVIRPFRCH